LGDGCSTLEVVQEGTVARLDSQDGSGSGQGTRILDKVRSTKIRANANMLYDPCGRYHGGYISEDERKDERATLGRFNAKLIKDPVGPRIVKKKWRQNDNEYIPGER
jgi:hypothetical protein